MLKFFQLLFLFALFSLLFLLIMLLMVKVPSFAFIIFILISLIQVLMNFFILQITVALTQLHLTKIKILFSINLKYF